MLRGPLADLSLSLPNLLTQFHGNGGAGTFAMATLDAGWCARDLARDARDYKSIWINWSSVSVPGTVELRIETIDTTTLKPTGTLYDANATKTFTPTAGWQNVQFTTLPTTGRVKGNLYGIVLVTTVAGTTQTIRSNIAFPFLGASNPSAVLHGAGVATRTNFADVAGGQPILTMVMEDDVEERGATPFAVHSVYTIFGTKALANKLILPVAMKVDGLFSVASIGNIANLTGDLRAYVLNSGNNIVADTDVTLTRKTWPSDFVQKQVYFPFDSLITLPPDTYYLVLRNSNSASIASASFNVAIANLRAAAVVGSGLFSTSTVDITAGSPTWVDDSASFSNIVLSPSDLDLGASDAAIAAATWAYGNRTLT